MKFYVWEDGDVISEGEFEYCGNSKSDDFYTVEGPEHAIGLLQGRGDKIYEVVDATDDETYYVLGIFNSAGEAERSLNHALCPESPFSEYTNDNDYEKIEIRERKIGWGGSNSKTIKTIERVCEYSEKKDDYFWVPR